MAKAWICDRCGKYTQDGLNSVSFEKRVFFNCYGWTFEKGLCDKCYRKFRMFMDGEELRCSTETEENG